MDRWNKIGVWGQEGREDGQGRGKQGDRCVDDGQMGLGRGG